MNVQDLNDPECVSSLIVTFAEEVTDMDDLLIQCGEDDEAERLRRHAKHSRAMAVCDFMNGRLEGARDSLAEADSADAEADEEERSREEDGEF